MKTHCKNGHEFTPDNTRITKQGWRVCVACKKDWDAEYRSRPGHREKNAKRGREWRENNRQRSREIALATYDRIRAVIEKAKDVPCMDCKERYPHYVMDFDHRDPSKKLINVGATRSLAKTLAEIEKCDVVCSNCHRERTWKDKCRGR